MAKSRSVVIGLKYNDLKEEPSTISHPQTNLVICVLCRCKMIFQVLYNSFLMCYVDGTISDLDTRAIAVSAYVRGLPQMGACLNYQMRCHGYTL